MDKNSGSLFFAVAIFSAFMLPCVMTGKAQAQSVSIATWQNNAKGAYSMIMDDFPGSWTPGIEQIADTMLANRGLAVSIATIVTHCTSAKWQVARDMVSRGHRIECHSGNHLQSWGANPNPYNLSDPFRPKYQVFGTAEGLSGLNSFVSSAVSQGGWALRETHGVQDASWNPVPIDTFRAHLDFCRQEIDNGNLWMAPAQTVLKYIYERKNYAVSVQNANVSQFEILFQGNAMDSSIYDLPLTLLVKLPVNYDSVEVVQGGTILNIVRLNPDSIMFNANPFRGIIAVQNAGSSHTSDQISLMKDAGIKIWPNPVSGKANVILLNTNREAPFFDLNIYDIRGRMVYTSSSIQHSASGIWDGRDNFGNQMGCGSYIVELRNGSDCFRGNITFIK